MLKCCMHIFVHVRMTSMFFSPPAGDDRGASLARQ